MISIVICSIHPARFTRIEAHYRELLGADPFEIIGIHDAKSLCEGYNRGLEKSRGEIVIFSHDDIEIWTPDFVPRLKAHLAKFDAVGVAGTDLLTSANWLDAGPPHVFGQVAHMYGIAWRVLIYGAPARIVGGIQALDGMFLAFRRAAIEQVRWDAETFRGFHLYDLDCTYRAFRAGLKLGVALDLPMWHMSDGRFDDRWQRYVRIFLEKHGTTLAPITGRTVRTGGVEVSTKAEAIAVMNGVSDFWNDPAK